MTHLDLRSMTLVAILLASSMACAQTAKTACDVSAVKSDLTAVPALGTAGWSSTRCGALISVFKRLAGAPVPGGRKLEKDRALDVAAAEKERADAAADPEFAKALAAELQGESNPARRMLLEAAVLDEAGAYKARDLLLMRLRTEGAK